MEKTKITIIGLGLIGGSLGLLLKNKTNCQLVGFSLHKQILKKALKIGAIDLATKSLIQAVGEAEIVFITTPISVIETILKQIAGFLKPGTIVTDVASIKEAIVKKAEKILPENVTFIGGHPMAGKEKNGIDNASVDLLKNCPWVLTPTDKTNQHYLTKLIGLIRQIGCRPLLVDSVWHDQAVACISHLPAILSSVLCTITAQEEDWITKQKLAAEGFRDASRLAANPPALQTDFCLANHKNLEKLISKAVKNLRDLRKILEKQDRNELFAFFQKAQKIRNDWWLKSRFYD